MSALEQIQQESNNVRLLPQITDYKTICAPYVEQIRDVLEGKAYRTKIQYGQTWFHFYHGCLMVKVNHEGQLFALPPMDQTEEGRPFINLLPEHQQHWLDEFMELPKDVLMFYFSLMKEVFKGHAIKGRLQTASGQTSWGSVPAQLEPLFDSVDWNHY